MVNRMCIRRLAMGSYMCRSPCDYWPHSEHLMHKLSRGRAAHTSLTGSHISHHRNQFSNTDQVGGDRLHHPYCQGVEVSGSVIEVVYYWDARGKMEFFFNLVALRLQIFSIGKSGKLVPKED